MEFLINSKIDHKNELLMAGVKKSEIQSLTYGEVVKRYNALKSEIIQKVESIYRWEGSKKLQRLTISQINFYKTNIDKVLGEDLLKTAA